MSQNLTSDLPIAIFSNNFKIKIIIAINVLHRYFLCTREINNKILIFYFNNKSMKYINAKLLK